jgi:hypothetical protein
MIYPVAKLNEIRRDSLSLLLLDVIPKTLDDEMTKKSVFHIFGIISLFIIAEFWVRYLAFCRLNAISPFNEFVHRYLFAGEGLILLMIMAIIGGGVASFSSKFWLLTSVLALGTILFIFSQIT